MCVLRVFVWRYVSAYVGFGVVHLLRFVSRLYNRHFQTPSLKPGKCVFSFWKFEESLLVPGGIAIECPEIQARETGADWIGGDQ